MSDEIKPDSDSESSETGKTAESAALHFIAELATRRQKLSSPAGEGLEVSTARRQAEWAKTMLNNRQFTEAIQLMNEQVMTELVATSPMESEKLVALCVRAQVISDFAGNLAGFIDNYEAIKFQQEFEAEREEDFG